MHILFPLFVSIIPPDDELVCSKHLEDGMIETHNGNKVCVLLVFLRYTIKCLYTFVDLISTSQQFNAFLRRI